ncbi:hypothetical protein ACQEVF_52700 [Nonomuraea polychroma]|uniref:hypothetical protein n=1 Tax=Nonomuraea polychroma TaxID=46176 RepID=UPI003D91EC31
MRIAKHLARASMLAVAATALAGSLAGPAHAASPGTAELANGKLTYTAGAGGINSVGISLFRGEIAVFDTEPLTAKGGCRQLTPRAVLCGTSVQEFTADLGDMDDSFSIGPSIKGTVNGGNGQDFLIASNTSNVPRQITFFGGPGIDEISYKGSNSFVRVSLDNQANDGRNIDSDNIRDDVENIVGSAHGGDFLIGADFANNRIDDGGGSGDKLFGLSGNDELLAKDLAADTDLDCGLGGADRIVIDKTLDSRPVGCETVEKF